MMLEQVVRKLKTRAHDLGNLILGDDPTELLHEQAYRLREALRNHYAALAEQQAAAKELRDRLARQEKQANFLAARVRICLGVEDRANAWKFALQLDEVRQALQADRPRLRQHLLACREHQSHLDHLGRRLANIEEKLYQINQGLGRRVPLPS
jgi:hypothetical protein